mmetsp:Transcript_17982/g.37293  ORF Transcript_17982/g.37293 Transcript_17982/m.37293 type:complete len:224 (-) Transcript_17982:186-857(-)
MKVAFTLILFAGLCLVQSDRSLEDTKGKSFDGLSGSDFEQISDRQALCPAILCIALACTTPPLTSFPTDFEGFTGSAVFLATVVKRLTTTCVGSQHLYVVRVRRVFKGCPPAERRVVVELPCFANALKAGDNDIFFANLNTKTVLGLPWYTTDGCSGVYPSASPSIRYANQRRNGEICPITGKCLNGQEVVKCFADPCQVSPCPNAASICSSSYCGGCNRLCL